MKKFIVFCLALFIVGMGMSQTINTANATFSKDEAVKERFALKREHLAEVVSKKITHVENSIKKKLEAKETKRAQKKQQEEAKKVEEEQAANQKALKETEKESAASQQAVEETPPLSPENTEGTEAVSGASANGQEIGRRNREWGEQLSDPNLTPEERQGIIQEKKNYNRYNH